MTKSQMSPQQLNLFNDIINFFESKGWKYNGDISWLEQGLWVEPEVGMIYLNSDFEILIQYSIEKDLFTIILTSIESTKEIIFDVFPENKMKELMDFLVKNQDDINETNYQDHIKLLLNICPKIFTYKDGQAYRLKSEG